MELRKLSASESFRQLVTIINGCSDINLKEINECGIFKLT